MYLSYDEYKNRFNGDLDEETFNRLEIKATGTVNYYTFNKIEEITDDIKYLIYELVEFEHSLEEGEKQLSEGIIKSETVGSHSVTYESGLSEKERKKQARDGRLFFIKMYLGHTGLLYRGG